MRIAIPLAAVAALAAGLIATAAPTALAGVQAGPAHTHRVVVRPVDKSGKAVSGWTVTSQKGLTVSCSGAAAASVSTGILECYPTVDYLPACWKSTNHTALCLRNARKHSLVRVTYRGSWAAAAAPKRPSPQDLTLGQGQPCQLRIGGAWGVLPSHPEWQGFYSCSKGSVYGPAKGDGINRAHQPWTVHLWKSGTKQDVVVRQVATAYYVGTAS